MTYIYIYFIVSAIITLGSILGLVGHFGSLTNVAESVRSTTPSKKLEGVPTWGIISSICIIGGLFSPFIVFSMILFGGFRE